MYITNAVTADDIARALGGRREGRHYMARCPAHHDRTPSLSIRQADDRVLVHCHAGCSQQAVIAALASRNLWPSNASPIAHAPLRPARRRDDDEERRVQRALSIWSATAPLTDTLAERRYLIEHRGLDIRSCDVAHALRWHPRIGALVALMTDPVTGEPCGIHRTFLNADGTKRERRMLGRQGVVRLSSSEVGEGLGISEGVEDAVAVLLSGWAPVWAATSAAAIARFPVLAGVMALTIFADADDPGIAAAQACAVRWQAAGREVRVSCPGEMAHV